MKPFSDIHPGIFTVTLLSLAAVLLTGCAGLRSRMEAPRVSLAAIRLKDLSGFEATFEVDLRVLNRSDIALQIKGIECSLALNGKQLAQGVADPQQEIAAFNSGIVPVTVYASLLDMAGMAHRLIKAASDPDTSVMEKWTYALDGSLRLGNAGLLNRIPFDAKGEIDLKELVGRP